MRSWRGWQWCARVLIVVLAGCGGGVPTAGGPIGSPELRAALFDSIVATTARREAFSEVKNARLGTDLPGDMLALRDAVIGAASEAELFYALARLSNLRRDRHLEVMLVPGGLRLPDSAGLTIAGAEDPVPAAHAPVRVLPDYSRPDEWFISDVAHDPAVADGPSPGDRIVTVNGVAIADWARDVSPWIRSSSDLHRRWLIGEALPVRSAELPPRFYSDSLRLEVERRDGTRSRRTLPYRAPESLQWRGLAEPNYPGFALERSTPTWDLFKPESGAPLLVLVWHGFRETMVADVDTLVAIGSRLGMLDHALIVDATRSRGGSLGPYALQRLQPRQFRTTLGNLRLSDVIAPFVEEKRTEFAARTITDGGVPETIDNGSWLMDWLESDVLAALARGDSLTAPVPFKLAHADRSSDGVLAPAPVHFRGPLVVFSGPRRGSHLDQFVSIVADNDLGHVIGMPAGGYSNTWEWTETLRYPGTRQPVVAFMWSIGQTIRPNGEVLEGNAADVNEALVLTRDNFDRYYPLLLGRAIAHFARTGHPAGRSVRVNPGLP